MQGHPVCDWCDKAADPEGAEQGGPPRHQVRAAEAREVGGAGAEEGRGSRGDEVGQLEMIDQPCWQARGGVCAGAGVAEGVVDQRDGGAPLEEDNALHVELHAELVGSLAMGGEGVEAMLAGTEALESNSGVKRKRSRTGWGGSGSKTGGTGVRC